MPIKLVENPLKEEHCHCLDRALERCPKIRQVIDACEAAGIDMTQAKEELEAHFQTASKLKQQFFPERV